MYEIDSAGLRKRLEEVCGSIVETVVRKNADYGNSYFALRDEYDPHVGVLPFLIRLGDKYARLKNLWTKGKTEVYEVYGESVADTIQDIVGYCLLELVYRGANSANSANKKPEG